MKTAAIVIGRFQPLHTGHMSLLAKAQEVGDVHVLIGSANRAPSITNPFSYETRAAWIGNMVGCQTYPLNDYLYDDVRWMREVHQRVAEIGSQYDKTVLVGHMKEGNDYLDWFPGMEFVNVEALPDGQGGELSGTVVREKLFNARMKAMSHVQEDWDYVQVEKAKFADYPYPETLHFMCADVLVIHDSKVLLVKRKNAPGKGLWALPGGFKNKGESLRQTALRELVEETGLVFSHANFGFVNTRNYSHPARNQGIPRVTQVFSYVSLSREEPKVIASDDASDVQWVPLSEIGKGEFMLFSDHQDIIFDLTNQ